MAETKREESYSKHFMKRHHLHRIPRVPVVIHYSVIIIIMESFHVRIEFGN